MFTTLLEDPTPIIVCGIVAEAILAWMLFQTGRGVLLWAMGGVLGLVLVGVLIERLVVTDRERVEATIDAAAAAVAANDLNAALALIDPQSHDVRDLLQYGMGQVRFDKAKVNRCEIRVIRTTSPMTAKAEVSGMVSGQMISTGTQVPYYAVDGTLEFRLEGDKWIVTGYTLKNDPRGQH